MSLLRQLNTLESVGLIRLAALQPELEYLFRHALVQDAAYSSLLKTDRKQLHQNTGEVLEQLYPERLAEIASTLALHFEKAQQLDKAIHYFALAATQAKARFANTEAIGFYESAIAQIEASPGQKNFDLLTRFVEETGDLLELIGQREAAREYFARALQVSAQHAPGELLRQARLHRKTATSFVIERSFAAALPYFAQGEQILQAAPTKSADWWQERIQNQLEQMWMLYFQNKLEEQEALIAQIRPWLEQYGLPAQKGKFSIGLLQISLRRKRFVPTAVDVEIQREHFMQCEALDSPRLLADASFTLGFVLFCYGAWEEAETRLLAACNLAAQIGDITVESRALAYLLLLYRMRKDIVAVERLLPRAREVFSIGGMKEYLPYIHACEAWQAWRAGNLNLAQAQAQLALDIFYQVSAMIPFQWVARWLLLDIALRQQNLPEALAQAKAILAFSQQKLSDDVTACLEAATQAEPERALEPLVLSLRWASEKGYL